MPANNSPLAYDDLRRVMDQALMSPNGVRLRCPNGVGEAYGLRSRMYKFRALDRKANRETYPKGDPKHGISVYDRLTIAPFADGDDIYLYLEVTNEERFAARIEEL